MGNPHPQKAQTALKARVDWRPHIYRILGVWVLALLCYSNSFHAGLVEDDVPVIRDDVRVHAATSQNVGLAFSEEYWYRSKTTGLYRPLTTLSYLFNYSILGNGEHPEGYHAVNLAIHLANIALVYLLGLLLFSDSLAALALAALWGVHPVLTESVTNLVGRADLLAAFGVLAGLLCHVRAAGSAGRPRLWWLAGLAAAAAVGIFSKESGVVLPAAMLLYDLAFRRRADWGKRLAGYAAVAVSFAAYFALRASMLANHPKGGVPFVDNPLVGADFWTARWTALTLILSDLRLVLWPAKLSFDYSYHQFPFAGWGDWRLLAAAALCGGAVAAAVLLYRKHRPEFFLIPFFFVALAPVSNLVIIIGATMAERFLYLPAIGILGCVVAAVHQARRPRVLAAVAAILCVAAGVRTYARNLDWHDELSLARSSAAATPEAFRPHYVLISALGNAGDLDGAVRESDTLLRILSPLPDEQNSMRAYEMAGECYRRKGDASPNGADEWYRKALATLLRAEHFGDLEREQIRQSNSRVGKRVRVPVWSPLYLELGRTYQRLNQPENALRALTQGQGAARDPAFVEELAKTYRQMGATDQAAVTLIEQMLIDPNSSGLAADLLRLYQETAPQSCAVKAGGTSIDMACPLVHTQVCTASQNVARWFRQGGQDARAGATVASAVNDLGCSADLFR